MKAPAQPLGRRASRRVDWLSDALRSIDAALQLTVKDLCDMLLAFAAARAAVEPIIDILFMLPEVIAEARETAADPTRGG